MRRLFSHGDLADRAAIAETILAYATGIDRRDWGSYRSIFLPEAAGVEPRSVSIDAARAIWDDRIGPLSFGVSSRSRAVATSRDLGWRPVHDDAIADSRTGSYAAAYRVGAFA